MTDIKVTQADRKFADKIYDCTDMDSSCVPVVSDCAARHRIEAQRPLLEALERLMDSIMERTKGDYAGSWDKALAAIEQAKGE